jgi:outer membrane biosynthesis protein TonB
MRSDYGLYGVAAICIILAALFAAGLVPGYTLSETSGIAVTVVFLLIGIIAAAVGYSARPKAAIPATESTLPPPPTPTIEEPTSVAEEPTTPPPPPPTTPLEEVSASPEPEPPQPIEPSEPSPVVTPVEEPAPIETVAEEQPKTTRRRRKKAVA